MTALLTALLATVVLTGFLWAVVPRTPPVQLPPPLPRCDLCGRRSDLRRVIEHPDDPLPSYWLACGPCAARITQTAPIAQETRR